MKQSANSVPYLPCSSATRNTAIPLPALGFQHSAVEVMWNHTSCCRFHMHTQHIAFLTPHCFYPLMPSPFLSLGLSVESHFLQRRRALYQEPRGSCWLQSLRGAAWTYYPEFLTQVHHCCVCLTPWNPDQGNLKSVMCLSFLIPSLEEDWTHLYKQNGPLWVQQIFLKHLLACNRTGHCHPESILCLIFTQNCCTEVSQHEWQGTAEHHGKGTGENRGQM